ncbi:MAG: endonuclease domain-containing protein [candidate division SR1 bacterium]|nr:endonuclease domain-containing protein [candidate division SR1 bacterium]
MTEAEGKIWNLGLRKDKMGYRFLRQKLLGEYILDFYCHKLKLGIEIDDSSHDFKGEYDEKRTKYLNSIGVEIIRYTNNNVHYNLDAVLLDLESKIAERSKKI